MFVTVLERMNGVKRYCDYCTLVLIRMTHFSAQYTGLGTSLVPNFLC
jgi:hypothetical protein